MHKSLGDINLVIGSKKKEREKGRNIIDAVPCSSWISHMKFKVDGATQRKQ